MIEDQKNVMLDDSALERIIQIKSKAENANKFLRVTVAGGGCSGFQYILALSDEAQDDDILIASDEKGDPIAVTDTVSMQFLKGSTVSFVKELGSSYFKVINPSAKANCGCGSSFSI
jgi:iron-sulfur cluster insertion protein